MANIELSICIPTYNRAQSVVRLVTDILSCEDSNIEVVVLDNCSTDDTMRLLRAIHDIRLFVYSNSENKGALFNMINVLNKGRGTYLVYSTDQDYIDKEKIIEFKLFLSQNFQLACGYCTFNSAINIHHKIFPRGYESVKNIAYKGRHPTGYFFKNEFLKKIKLVERFSDYSFVDLFPLEFVFAELSLMGNGAIYNTPLFTPETGEMVVKHKSSTTSGKSKTAFFAPEARIKLAINYSKHINTLQLTENERYLLCINVFTNELIASTIGYRSILKNKSLCIHYDMNSENVKINHLISIAKLFYKKYAIEFTNIGIIGVIKKSKFNAYVFSIIFGKIIRRLIKL